MAARKKTLPESTQEVKPLPNVGVEQKPVPTPTKKNKELPELGIPENTVFIGGVPIEIKPTKLKYQRNRTAGFYRVLELYPQPDVLTMEAGTFGDDRDGDKALMDWLIAATDNETLITEHYDDMDTETIERIISIFKKVNKIDEKDQKLKNLEKTRKEG